MLRFRMERSIFLDKCFEIHTIGRRKTPNVDIYSRPFDRKSTRLKRFFCFFLIFNIYFFYRRLRSVIGAIVVRVLKSRLPGES